MPTETVRVTLQGNPWELDFFVPPFFVLAGMQIQWLGLKQPDHTMQKKTSSECDEWSTKMEGPLGPGLPFLLHKLLTSVSHLVG